MVQPLLSNTNKAIAKASEELQGASTETGSYSPPQVTIGNNSNKLTKQLSETNAARNAQARANAAAPAANLFAGLTVAKGGSRKRRSHTRSRRNRRSKKN